MTDHEILNNLHRRMDELLRMQIEMRDRMNDHIARQSEIKPALDELVALWKGSKIIIPMLVAGATAVWAVIAWAKEHVR
jgi:hypothetical protein